MIITPRVHVIAAARTAIGSAFRGALAETPPSALAGVAVRAAIDRSGLEPGRFEDLVLGEVFHGGGDIARYVAVEQGFEHLPGMALNRQCASGLSAIATGTASVASGMADAVLAGGVESASLAPISRRRIPGTAGTSPEDYEDRWHSLPYPEDPENPPMNTVITVGWNPARRLGITREEQDDWALRSHHRAVAAIDAGQFEAEIVPIEVFARSGERLTFTVDEHPRRTTSAERLASLSPLHPEIEGFSITAGNSSGVNDGAAVVALASERLVGAENVQSLARVLSWATVGVAPADTAFAPTLAIPQALERAGLRLSDVALFEINEAFAAQTIACVRVLELDDEKVNIYGSGISLGHPVAATGARMLTSLAHALRRRGGGVGVVSMCAGGGMGSAMVIEV